jgi:hypothetical protein
MPRELGLHPPDSEDLGNLQRLPIVVHLFGPSVCGRILSLLLNRLRGQEIMNANDPPDGDNVLGRWFL